MIKRLVLLPVLALLLMIPAAVSLAQGAPEPINDALSDLSSRVGHTVSLGDLTLWQWSQESFPDASLGCPQPGQVYAQVVTVGYRFELTYGGVVYDYRVPADRSTVILCGTTSSGAPTPTTSPENLPSNPLCPPPDAGQPPYMRTRLAVGLQARVTFGTPNNLRNAPNRDAGIVGQIPGGTQFDILAGPGCDRGVLFWQVSYNGATGWTAEGQDGSYFLEPVPPDPLPARSVITSDNAGFLVELGKLQGNFVPRIAFSPDGSLLGVPGRSGSNGLWLYTVASLETQPRIIESQDTLQVLAFSPDSRQVLLGGFDGNAHLWNIYPNAPLLTALVLQTHGSNLTAVAFSPDGKSFATAGSNALTNAQVDRSNAILVWDIATVSQTSVLSGHTAQVNDIAFSADGTRLASVGGDGLRMWDVAGRTQLFAVGGGSSMLALDYRFDGAVIAVAGQNGSVTLLGSSDGGVFGTLTAHRPPRSGCYRDSGQSLPRRR